MVVLVLLLYSMAIVYCATYSDNSAAVMDSSDDSAAVMESSDYETVETNATRPKKEFMNKVRSLYDTLDELWNRVSYVNIHTLGAEVGRMGDTIMRQVNQRLHSYNYTDTYLQTMYNCSVKDINVIKDWHSKSRQLSDKLKMLFMQLKSKIIE